MDFPAPFPIGQRRNITAIPLFFGSGEPQGGVFPTPERLDPHLEAIQPLGSGNSFQARNAGATNIFTAPSVERLQREEPTGSSEQTQTSGQTDF